MPFGNIHYPLTISVAITSFLPLFSRLPSSYILHPVPRRRFRKTENPTWENPTCEINHKNEGNVVVTNLFIFVIITVFWFIAFSATRYGICVLWFIFFFLKSNCRGQARDIWGCLPEVAPRKQDALLIRLWQIPASCFLPVFSSSS